MIEEFQPTLVDEELEDHSLPLARIAVQPQSGMQSKKVWADENGRFRLIGLDASVYQLSASFSGYHFREQREVDLSVWGENPGIRQSMQEEISVQVIPLEQKAERVRRQIETDGSFEIRAPQTPGIQKAAPILYYPGTLDRAKASAFHSAADATVEIPVWKLIALPKQQ
ncbi:carboxypeptidase-like regulatory domain-containing protein [Bryobacter aggregatus]|uniref:carboxypeptidase-like regulatory domain-containing protein n=1 Tax=Bryobacter aggregatus TaxID=360054 RepID=UPI0004E0F9B5|nr:carboxypeptidase-like regulatory domain-containing protein [Bryobacter aggregatus]